jgi:hypothetical protein
LNRPGGGENMKFARRRSWLMLAILCLARGRAGSLPAAQAKPEKPTVRIGHAS